ncbi:MAG: GTP 3',8-cyclase MoaA [Anaerolineae bacterium]|nr:MAG: GTP 3',8-cyclase MoaA [Anaerolineae bacterium]
MMTEPTASLQDTLGRALRDLRISVTDRCNFRCTYCMPKEVFGRDYAFLPHAEVLTFEEIARLAGVFISLGTRKLRLTGGEPLMRRDLETLIAMLAAQDGAADIALTTNGSFPLERVRSLKAAGLSRMTVSLDSLDDAVFKSMNDVDFPPEKVLAWIDESRAAGFDPVKVNMVVKRGLNEDSLLPMARHFNQPGTILRFIEFMDVGHTNGWRMDDVVSAKEILRRLQTEMPLEPLDANYRGEVAQRYRNSETGAEIGIVASVTQPFCGDCNRARISADGKLFTCLFAIGGTDFKALLRGGASDDDLRAAITGVWQKRVDRYSELRTAQTADLPKVEMSFIGG